MLVVLSQGVSNLANDYMSYPTKLLFKASKLIMIMVVGRCVIGRQYHAVEVTTASLVQRMHVDVRPGCVVCSMRGLQ